MRVLRSDEALALSGGAITKPDSYNYRTMKPERGGLYCEEIFGAVDLKQEETSASGIVKRAVRLDADDRKERWGQIDLPIAVAHPLHKEETIEHVLVLPPAYRRFLRRSAEESRAHATKRRSELLAMINDPDWIGDCQTGTDRPDKLLAEEGLDDEAAIKKLGPTFEEPQLNTHYRAIVNDSHRTRRLRELGAPDEIVSQQASSLIDHITHLFEAIDARSDLDEAIKLRALSLAQR
jgi:DNA-directed RNA polymerase beta' subunit